MKTRDLVVIVDVNLSRDTWPLGRDKDVVLRVVDIALPGKFHRRAAKYLVRLFTQGTVPILF